MIITLDGYSGTGKSTLSKLVAEKLDFKCLNTGMIYRAITYYLLSNDILPQNIEQINKILPTLNVEVIFKNNTQGVVINDMDCTEYVSSIDVQKYVSLFSQIASVRHKTLSIQREFASKNNVVVEGRDIGTEVFPNADYKFFVVCDVKVRAKRRYGDLTKSNTDITLEEVEENLKKRDYLDSTRAISPLKQAEDAVVIDTSNKTIEQSLNEILSCVKQDI